MPFVSASAALRSGFFSSAMFAACCNERGEGPVDVWEKTSSIAHDTQHNQKDQSSASGMRYSYRHDPIETNSILYLHRHLWTGSSSRHRNHEGVDKAAQIRNISARVTAGSAGFIHSVFSATISNVVGKLADFCTMAPTEQYFSSDK